MKESHKKLLAELRQYVSEESAVYENKREELNRALLNPSLKVEYDFDKACEIGETVAFLSMIKEKINKILEEE